MTEQEWYGKAPEQMRNYIRSLYPFNLFLGVISTDDPENNVFSFEIPFEPENIKITVENVSAEVEEEEETLRFETKEELAEGEVAIAKLLQKKLAEHTPFLFAPFPIRYPDSDVLGVPFCIPFSAGRLEVTTRWIPRE